MRINRLLFILIVCLMALDTSYAQMAIRYVTYPCNPWKSACTPTSEYSVLIDTNTNTRLTHAKYYGDFARRESTLITDNELVSVYPDTKQKYTLKVNKNSLPIVPSALTLCTRDGEKYVRDGEYLGYPVYVIQSAQIITELRAPLLNCEPLLIQTNSMYNTIATRVSTQGIDKKLFKLPAKYVETDPLTMDEDLHVAIWSKNGKMTKEQAKAKYAEVKRNGERAAMESMSKVWKRRNSSHVHTNGN